MFYQFFFSKTFYKFVGLHNITPQSI